MKVRPGIFDDPPKKLPLSPPTRGVLATPGARLLCPLFSSPATSSAATAPDGQPHAPLCLWALPPPGEPASTAGVQLTAGVMRPALPHLTTLLSPMHLTPPLPPPTLNNTLST